MRHRWLALPVACCALAAGCGAGEAAPITRSTLPAEVPSVQAFSLVDALPEPADFGPGWVFDTESVNDFDYFESYGTSVVAEACEGADPAAAGIPAGSAHRVSALMKRERGEAAVEIMIAVDGPAGSADRLSFIRAVFEGCGKVEAERQGVEFVAEHELLEPPEIEADQVVVGRLESERKEDGDSAESVQIKAYARVGGLVVSLIGLDGADPVPLLPAAVAEARTALKL